MGRASVAVLVFLLLGIGCAPDETNSDSSPPSFQKEGRLTFLDAEGDTLRTIDIEIADTDSERKTGLMRRRSLGYDRGMLFVFNDTSRNGMWMKNTPLPLDIIFLSPDSQVINIARGTTPFSEKTITPHAPRKFAIEVRAGFADQYGLSDSTSVRWTRRK